MTSATSPGRLRLLHIIRSADPRGGGPIEGVIQQDAAMGIAGTREIVSLDPPDAPFLEDLKISVHAMGVTPYADLGRNKLSAFGYSPKLVPWLRANVHVYDCVFINGLWNYASVGSSLVLPGGGVPYFVFSHGMMDPWFRRTYPMKHHLKQLSWLLFEGRLAAGAQAILFTSQEELKGAQGAFAGHAFKSEIVRYGTSVPEEGPDDQQAFHARCPTLMGRPYLLFLSRIHEKKGCDLLIEAFATVRERAPELQLVMAGPDQAGWVQALKAETIRLGFGEQVHWPGMLSGNAKWGAFRGAEAFVLPSHQENFGIVVAESLGCGTPVLISDKVNIWREILDGGAGFVEPDDLRGTTALLDRWLRTPAAERSAMGMNARRTFESHFDIQAAAEDVLAKVQAVARSGLSS